MSKKVTVINGPNLNMLGKREPDIYGQMSLSDIRDQCISLGDELGLEIEFLQSNHEGQLIDWLHESNDHSIGVVLNAGAYTHTSIALHDAIKAISIPTIEIHISNVHAREEFRHISKIAPAASGVICGFGANSYNLAIRALAE